MKLLHWAAVVVVAVVVSLGLGVEKEETAVDDERDPNSDARARIREITSIVTRKMNNLLNSLWFVRSGVHSSDTAMNDNIEEDEDEKAFASTTDALEDNLDFEATTGVSSELYNAFYDELHKSEENSIPSENVHDDDYFTIYMKDYYEEYIPTNDEVLDDYPFVAADPSVPTCGKDEVSEASLHVSSNPDVNQMLDATITKESHPVTTSAESGGGIDVVSPLEHSDEPDNKDEGEFDTDPAGDSEMAFETISSNGNEGLADSSSDSDDMDGRWIEDDYYMSDDAFEPPGYYSYAMDVPEPESGDEEMLYLNEADLSDPLNGDEEYYTDMIPDQVEEENVPIDAMKDTTQPGDAMKDTTQPGTEGSSSVVIRRPAHG